MFIQNDATGGGAGNLDPNQAAIDLAIIANGDTGLGLNAQVGNRQQVTYARTLGGAPPTRLDTLVNNTFNPNYGGGAQQVDIVVLPVQSNFVLNDGTPITSAAGVALAPQGSGLAGDTLNTTNDCLAIYDTSENNGDQYCVARDGTGGTLDLQMPRSVILYHELSHCLRIVNNNLQPLTAGCNPSSPEENAAIVDENDLRTQIANATGDPINLRDPGIHCGQSCAGGGVGVSCCIIASVASKSPMSAEVQFLREIRDGFIRKTDVGFELFRNLFRDYYAFSPQICTLMARHHQLPDLVLKGYVQPLIWMLQTLQAYSVERPTSQKLGQMLVDHYESPAEAGNHLAYLKRVRSVMANPGTVDNERAQTIKSLLHDKAFSSEHVRWALIEPVEIFGLALEAHASDANAQGVGALLENAFEDWSSRMPIDHVWASLPEKQLRREWRVMANGFLRSVHARRNFAQRLMDAFGHITAVKTVIEFELAKCGETL